MARRKKRQGSAEAQTEVPADSDGAEEGSVVGSPEIHLEPAGEPEEMERSGEGLLRLSEVPCESPAGELGETEPSGRADGVAGDSEQLQQPVEPGPTEPGPDAASKNAGLFSLGDPMIADLHPVVVAFLQLSQHQFALHLQRQGLFTMPDGTLAVSAELVHQLRTQGIEGMSFSQQAPPPPDLDERIEEIAQRVALRHQAHEPAPVMSPATAAPPARPQAGSPGSRYPLGHMLSGGR